MEPKSPSMYGGLYSTVRLILLNLIREDGIDLARDGRVKVATHNNPGSVEANFRLMSFIGGQ
jgi:hypothetical protein